MKRLDLVLDIFANAKRTRPWFQYDAVRHIAASLSPQNFFFTNGFGRGQDVAFPVATNTSKSFRTTNLIADGQLQQGEIAVLTGLAKMYAPRFNSTNTLAGAAAFQAETPPTIGRDSQPQLTVDIENLEAYSFGLITGGIAPFIEIKIANDLVFMDIPLFMIPSAWNNTPTGGDRSAFPWLQFGEDCALLMSSDVRIQVIQTLNLQAATTLNSGNDLIQFLVFAGKIAKPVDYEAKTQQIVDQYSS